MVNDFDSERSGLLFTFTAGDLPEKTFAVAEFSLQEELSELFTLSLTLVSKRADIDLGSLLLQSVKFRVVFNDVEQRQVSGIIAQAVRGDSHTHRTIYYLTVRPTLWRMNLNQDSRIYHRQSVPEILKSLLKKHYILADSQLNEFHYTREYVTQKRESDYEFFARLVAEEGLNFWFEDDKLFFSDCHLGMTANLPLVYNPEIAQATEMNVVNQVRLGVSMTPQRVIYKDRNPQNPAYRLTHRANVDPRVVGEETLFSIFESYGRFQKDAEAKPFVQRRQQAVQNQQQAGSGQSNCFKLMPGKIFDLSEHPVDEMNTRWQIVTIHHYGKCPQALQETCGGSGSYLHNEFSFISGYKDWRALYRYKPLADGDEVATVVGPAGEEIYVNKEGCIRVHFHWDRYDKADENASCWIRFSQGWNGSGYGFMAVPRIGQEVIVSYLNGDIDRPIVTGCTYNGLNRPPLDLPAEKTRTTFKTQTHKGEGFNELRFEDAKDQEEVFIHAQRDMKTQILNDETVDIANNRLHHVKHDAHLRVDNEYRVLANNDISVSTGKKLHVKADDALLMQGGNEIHLRSGTTLIIDAGGELTLQAAGHFLKIDAGGITSSAGINFGSGVPGIGSGWGGKLPDMLQKEMKQVSVDIPTQIPKIPGKGLCISCLLKAELEGATTIIRKQS
ncbi:type VI secretion system tip protein VgrG [Photorhabdus khanii]|uniref:Type VI secretion system tip protein VgrG n=1 Tax=Photorhabdus khanii TaxID=1004150 RepID=A0A7C9KHI8_9GAMM|nr:type VI secretion system tip protein TssI/VgrG [Photorhabdus khanii]MQL49564.1 type VI secretion system tip protein VgrG [Photorhabdus khanii]